MAVDGGLPLVLTTYQLEDDGPLVFTCLNLAKFQHDLKPAVAVFKAARLFFPNKVNDLSPYASSVNSIKAFPFFQDSVLLSNLNTELPCYLTCVADLGQDIDPLD